VTVVKRFSAQIRNRTSHLDVRRFLMFGLVFAFLAQAQLAAAHFHIGVDAKEQALFGLADSKAPAKNKAPLGDRDCPISQLVAASHSYVAGFSPAVVLPMPAAEQVVVERTQSLPVALIALNWRSRAPPV
jgi:hypothetical protein